jgi:NAD(P)H-dependent FMN reductase
MSSSILLIIGSPRLRNSNSYSIAHYINQGLEKHGWNTEIVFAHKAFSSEKIMNDLIEKTQNATVIGIILPLYVDSIPGPLGHVLDRLCEIPQQENNTKKIFAIVNQGFPEPHQSDLAVKIIEQFTREYQATFIGGYTIGAGGIIGRMPIDQIKHRSKRLVKSLDLTIQSLHQHQSLSDEAQLLLSKPLFPKSLYLFFGDMSWKKQAKKYGVKNLYQKPDKQI